MGLMRIRGLTTIVACLVAAWAGFEPESHAKTVPMFTKSSAEQFARQMLSTLPAELEGFKASKGITQAELATEQGQKKYYPSAERGYQSPPCCSKSITIYISYSQKKEYQKVIREEFKKNNKMQINGMTAYFKGTNKNSNLFIVAGEFGIVIFSSNVPKDVVFAFARKINFKKLKSIQ